ncbi:MAG: EF-hand domain-containing protein [Planctomycetota bacterium]|jgi:Ca2+-binding EF-hand superfamily protein
MKRLGRIMVLTVGVAFVLSAGNLLFAQDDDPDKNRRQQLKEKFDKNKDGKLDEEERAALKKFMEEHKKAGKQGPKAKPSAKGSCCERRKARWEKILEKFDKDGDGELNEEEKAALKAFQEEQRRKRILEKWDVNGDGELDEEEKQAMEAAREARQKKIREKYDKNKNGKLDPPERAKMHKDRAGKGDGKHKNCCCKRLKHKRDQQKKRGDKDKS